MLTNENGNGMVMPVSPMGGYGYGGGFGMSADWLILFVIAMMFGGFGGNWGMGGNAGMGIDFPWLMNGQNAVNANTNAGFAQAATQGALGDIQLAIANLSQSLCQCCNGMQSAITQQLYNGQMADLQRAYEGQIATMQGFNGVTAGMSDLKATVLSENCNDRFEAQKNTQEIITAMTAGIQSLKDDACQRELAAERRANEDLRNQLQFAQLTSWMSQNCGCGNSCGCNNNNF